MDKYIKREDVLTVLTYNGLDDPPEIISLLLATARKKVRHIPGVDVVPKSEVIPCKIGDTVWGITKYSGGLTRKARKSTVSAMFFLDDMRLCIVARSISRGEWGKEIFATQEEAEAAIERCGQ